MPKLKPGTILPTDTEDAEISRQAMSGTDNMPLTAAELSQFQPAGDMHGSDVVEALEKKRRGRPVGSNKTRTTINLDNDVIAWAKGDDAKGWQTRINAALRHVMEEDRQ